MVLARALEVRQQRLLQVFLPRLLEHKTRREGVERIQGVALSSLLEKLGKLFPYTHAWGDPLHGVDFFLPLLPGALG